MLSIREIAGEIWTRMYPDRRPWDQIGEAAQDEWEEFTRTAFIIFREKGL